MKNHNIPKLRYPEFTDAWEKWELNKIAIKVTEKNKDGIFQETLTNSAEFGVISQRDFFDKDISNPENLNGYYIVKPNDFVYNPRISNLAPVGPIKRNQLNRIGVMSPLYFIFRVSSNIDLDFLDAFFSTNLWHLFMKLNGDSGARADRIAIKDKIFMEMPISLPTLPEQQKIGNLFKQLDRLITLHKRKWDDVILLKKALLQKMFPKNGADFPEIRFPEFTDAWEKCKLGEVIINHSSSNYIQEAKAFGEFEVIQQGNTPIVGYSNEMPFENFENVLCFGDHTTSLYKPLTPFLLATDGVKILSIKGVQGYFILSFFERYKPNAEGYKRHFSILKKQQGYIPPLPEQQKIGNLFKQLDHLITLHKRQHEHYQLLKKALLQQMFV
ncbi:restriction endonuclease subunit S [Avibacterium endocarditidis]|uniref:restriction endonuclease subunit S n=1 Tax=Avibacterium endocarditidis TaxID=380674 RepID=UPI003BF88638